jgi:hydroxyethylthiazole kinase-like uncharacterized protein yjeF
MAADDLHAALKRHPLPAVDREGGKEERGRVLVVGGGAANPGAAMLAACAAMRVGAGKLRIASAARVCVPLGIAVPEARVDALEETAAGEISRKSAASVAGMAESCDALLLGPGMLDEEHAAALTRALLREVSGPLVLDAGALAALDGEPGALAAVGRGAVITPHHGEMAMIMGISREQVAADPRASALEVARQSRAVVMLKDAATWVAEPGGESWCWERANPGLGTSGSGDVMAGIVTGLLARGADPVTAALWSVYLHAMAGDALLERVGPVGFLARELPAELPGILRGTE